MITETDKPNSNKTIHWGTVTEDLKLIPNSRYLYASMEERRKLIFPEGWDLGEAEKLVAGRKVGRPKSVAGDRNRLYRATWLLKRIAEKTGLREDLEETFDGNKDMVNDILTMAIFPYITNFTYNWFARWQNIEKSPSDRALSPKDITLLTQKITERHRMKFLSLRAKRVGEQELCAVDSTSRTAYGALRPTSSGDITKRDWRSRRPWRWWSTRFSPTCPYTTGLPRQHARLSQHRDSDAGHGACGVQERDIRHR